MRGLVVIAIFNGVVARAGVYRDIFGVNVINEIVAVRAVDYGVGSVIGNIYADCILRVDKISDNRLNALSIFEGNLSFADSDNNVVAADGSGVFAARNQQGVFFTEAYNNVVAVAGLVLVCSRADAEISGVDINGIVAFAAIESKTVSFDVN